MIAWLSWASAWLAASVLLLIFFIFIMQIGRVVGDVWMTRSIPKWENLIVDSLFDPAPSVSFFHQARWPWNKPVVVQVMMKVIQNLEGAPKVKCASSFEALGAVDQELRRLKALRPYIRARAAVRLGSMGNDRAVPLLMERLNDSHTDVRYAVIQALGQLKAQQATMAILEHADALEPYHWSALVTILNKLQLVDHVEGRAYVLKHLLGRAETFRLGVVIAGTMQMHEALLVFWEGFHASSSVVKREIAKAVAQMGDPASARELVGFLRDPDPEVRVELLNALGSLQEPSVISWVMPLAQDPVWEVSEAAIHTLAKLDESGEALAQVLEVEDDVELAKYKAAMMLEEMGTLERWMDEMSTASGDALKRVRQRLRLATKYEADQPILRRAWKPSPQN